ncbi:MAG: hypothetical protein KF764_00830 [Labilithrix sp.]|nr:hypothetical protein [Labilithrix sp.]
MHLVAGEGLGFLTPPEPTEAWPDATCDACASEPEWTEAEALERVRVLCASCWEDAFARNTRVRPHADGGGWIHAARHRAAERQARWLERFAINAHRHYQMELEDEVPWLGFGESAARIHLRCDALVIGTWSPRSRSWLWGWANGSIDARLTTPIIPVKRFGESNGLASLWRMKSENASEDDAFALAACTLDVLAGLDAVYRVPTEGVSLFLGVVNTRHVA